MIGRSAPALGPVITDKAIAQCLFGRALDRWIDRRADPQAARVNAIGAGFGGLPEFSDQFAPDIFDKPAAHAVGLGLIGPGRAEWRSRGSSAFGIGDIDDFGTLTQHPLPPNKHTVGVASRLEIRKAA